MSFFDSPIAPCEVVHEMVMTDETQAECAREHECPPASIALSRRAGRAGRRCGAPMTLGCVLN